MLKGITNEVPQNHASLLVHHFLKHCFCSSILLSHIKITCVMCLGHIHFISSQHHWFGLPVKVKCGYHPDHPVTKESMLTSETYVCAGDKTNAIKRERKHQIFGCKIIILCNISMQNDTFTPLHQSGIGTISTMCRSPKMVSQSTCASCWMSKGHT